MSIDLGQQIFIGFFGLALLFVPLEYFFSYHKQPLVRSGLTTDTLYYILGCCIGVVTESFSVAVAALILRANISLLWVNTIQSQPFWLQFIEIIIISDFFAYLIHRTLHQVPWLWQFHQIHHSARPMDWLANVRLHPIDKILGDCVQFIPVLCLGFSENVLFAYIVFLGLHGFLNHSNIRVNIGWLKWLIATPEFHHWHHCTDSQAYDSNFAPHTLIFDRLFGTLYFPKDQHPQDYGLEKPIPSDYWGQLWYPFRNQ